MRLKQRVLVIIVLLSLLAISSVQAQDSDSTFFNETKHNVDGAFWTYYQSVPWASTLFGFPITEAYTTKDGVYVQYFQRARFELRGQQVTVSPLGELTYRAGAQLNINNPLACRVFSQTGYSVCFAFLEYFDEYGGLDQFGTPISPFEYQDGKIVQYFKNARFEWRPTNPNGQHVVLTDVGSIHFQMAGEDPTRLEAVRPLDATIKPLVLNLNVHAFPWKAVTGADDTQRLFVIVQDQTKTPVGGATGMVVVSWPSGDNTNFTFTTDQNGIASINFNIRDQPEGGLVEIRVWVKHDELDSDITTSFRIWY